LSIGLRDLRLRAFNAVQEVEDAMGVSLHSGLEGVPLLRVDDVGKGMDLEIVLDVDG
jgi:hypothetical protein